MITHQTLEKLEKVQKIKTTALDSVSISLLDI